MSKTNVVDCTFRPTLPGDKPGQRSGPEIVECGFDPSKVLPAERPESAESPTEKRKR